MKICLINPPHPYLKQPTSQAPLGLLYVAAALEEAGHEVECLDFSSFSYDEDFPVPEADLYGLTGTVIDRVPILVVANHIKLRYPKAKVVVGGPISLTPQYLSPFVDAIVQGEGEHIILNVLRDLPNNLKPVYKADRITDLDALPFPARHLLDRDHLGGNVFAFNHNYMPGGSTVLISSRGCPFSCAFCASPGIWGRKVVFRSPENILTEVDHIKDRYGITQLRFSDDNLTLRQDHLAEICRGLKERNVVWRASIRVVPNDLEMFQMMFEAGCREVSFGIESADPNVLDKVSKGVTPTDNMLAILNASKAGLVVRILFMIGTPGETDQTVDLNIDFLEAVKDNYATIALTNFIPIPGSDIASNPIKYDCQILDTNIDHYNFYLWGPDGMNNWQNLIAIDGLSQDKLWANRERMKQYVVNSGKSNLG